MAWEENSCISLNMQLIAILSRIGVSILLMFIVFLLVLCLLFYSQSWNFVLAVFAYMPSVTPCAFIDREMNAMFLSHCFRSLFRNRLWWICHLRLTTSSGDVAVFAEYAKSIVRDENVSPCALSRQLIPYSRYNVFYIHSPHFGYT